ncbi:MAG: flagellar motor protein MotB [Oligoflexia bacterium]|nr:flagellar motor protein MotB [Oligoflexia bacterium]
MKVYSKASRIRKSSETWQVVYIDLMTNMMVIFIILWALNQVKPQKASSRIGDTTSHMVNLAGDVIFAPKRSSLSTEGISIFKNLFGKTDDNPVLNFNTGEFTKRYLVIHGHTDGDGDKDKNFQLGFDRALETYHQMRLYNNEASDHVILCSHADNSPLQEINSSKSAPTRFSPVELRAIKAKNRRITIEDKIDSRVQIQ